MRGSRRRRVCTPRRQSGPRVGPPWAWKGLKIAILPIVPLEILDTSEAAAGSGENRDPAMVAFQEVLDRLNDLFDSEDLTDGQKVSFLEALLGTLLNDPDLVQQAKVNSTKQFTESPDFDEAVKEAVADNHGAHQKMSDYFFSSAPGRADLIADIAKWFYKVVAEEGE